MAEEYEDRVVFVGVSNNDTVADGLMYQDRFDVPYALGNAPEVWGVYGDPFRPTTVVIDPNGLEVARIDGPITVGRLRKEIERALSAA